jgi:prephenate dehydrogenase
MTAPFSPVSILGGGLLGGSLALALGRRPERVDVRLWCRRPAATSAALGRGIRGATGDLAAAVKDAELLVLAVPVGAMPDLLAAALAAGLPDACLVTDVGSVKQLPQQTLPPLLASQGAGFIGSHPMAGSEKTGVAAADPGLFEGTACLLTNDGDAPASLAERLERFWRGLGCDTSWWSAAAHDALVARISHLPHLLAASAARVCVGSVEETACAGNGLRDTTRVASGEPGMWAEILLENRAALLGPLRESIADLAEILAMLEASDPDSVREWLATAKSRRDTLG